MNRTTLLALPLLVAGCAHHGTLATPHGNVMIMGRHGLPEFSGQVNRCPSGFGEGPVQKAWDSTGKKLFTGHCQGGLMVGHWTAYYENGATEWKANFVGGVITGEFKSWYANDQQWAKVHFAEGVPHGGYKSWHINGEVAAKGDFIAGKKNGCWETWHENGQQATKGTYSDDRQVHTWLHWTPDGQRRKEKLGGDALHGECLLTL